MKIISQTIVVTPEELNLLVKAQEKVHGILHIENVSDTEPDKYLVTADWAIILQFLQYTEINNLPLEAVY